jgi:hypothetical protein
LRVARDLKEGAVAYFKYEYYFIIHVEEMKKKTRIKHGYLFQMPRYEVGKFVIRSKSSPTNYWTKNFGHGLPLNGIVNIHHVWGVSFSPAIKLTYISLFWFSTVAAAVGAEPGNYTNSMQY